MTLRRLKWIFLAGLLAFFLFVEFARFHLDPFLNTLAGRLVMDLVILMGSLFLLGLAFDSVARVQGQLERRNRELLTLQRAALDIYGDLSLDTVLQKVVDQATQLLDARYGAVTVVDDAGEIQQFIVSGLGPADQERIGTPPRGIGLLGLPLKRGQRLRIADVDDDPRAAGFPEHHPQMHSLLAVPITCKGPFRGNLYLSEKESAPEFSTEDEETLVRFATAASIAIDNAHLHQQLRALAVAEERARIAREMHDGMAQVLAYVNTKAQAVQEFMARDKPEQARQQLAQLAEAAREVYVDVREQIYGLRIEKGPDRPLAEALREFVDGWQRQSGIAADLEMDLDGGLDLPLIAELQLFRIVQEALANVRKHSQARSTRIRVGLADGRLVATVEDDGTGFDPSARVRADLPRFGLAIMRERAESIGGDLELQSLPGEGTRVTVAIPLVQRTV